MKLCFTTKGFSLLKRKDIISGIFVLNERVKTKDAGFVYESFRNKTNRVIWNFFFSQKESTKRIFQKRIHETNPQNESFKKGLQNESTKRIFWNQYGFANPKPRIRKDSGLFKVRLCTKDLSGFVRICWICENRSNLLKISLRNESTKRIFWKH